MDKLRGALAEALSLTLIASGVAYATRLGHSPAVVSALVQIFATLLFSLATHVESRAKRRSAKARRNKYWKAVAILTVCTLIQGQTLRSPSFWKGAAGLIVQRKWAIILIVPGIFHGQVQYAAQERVGVAAVITITTLGTLGLFTWRLVEGGPSRPWHIVWFVTGLAGVIMLTSPFTAGADPRGLVLAGLCSAISVNIIVASTKLAQSNLTRIIELMRWATVCLVGIPVIVSTDDHWVTGQVLTTVAVSATLIMLANKLHIRAVELTRSDGIISTVACTNPVLGCVAGFLIGTDQPPRLYGWLGAGLVVTASAVALQILIRRGNHADPPVINDDVVTLGVFQRRSHTGPPVVKDGVWKHRFSADRNDDWIADPGSGVRLPGIWKADDWGQHQLA